MLLKSKNGSVSIPTQEEGKVLDDLVDRLYVIKRLK